MSALDVDCPRCLAPATWGCEDSEGRWKRTVHRERRALAAHLAITTRPAHHHPAASTEESTK